jgi:glycosyltransferase involved in cell wall biosynthesis
MVPIGSALQDFASVNRDRDGYERHHSFAVVDVHALMFLSKSTAHDPRVMKEARSLVDAGNRVTIIEWDRSANQQPRESMHGADVVRVQTVAVGASPGEVARSMPRWWRNAKKLAESLFPIDFPDVIHCHDLDTLPIGVRLKRKWGKPLIFDAHERYWQVIGGSLPFAGRGAKTLEKRLLRHVDGVITVNDSMAREYGRRRPAFKVENRPLPSDLEPWSDEPFTAAYVGVFSEDRMFPDLLHAFGQNPEFQLILAGKNEGLYDAVEEAAKKYDNISFEGALNVADVPQFLSRAHAVLCPLDPSNPQYRTAMPTKVFDAMAVGRAVLASAGTYAATWTMENGVGATFDHSPDSMIAAVRKMRDTGTAQACGLRGRELIQGRGWVSQEPELLRAYQTVLEN